MTVINLSCQHQAARLYVVPGAEGNWVCSHRLRAVHSLAGVLTELSRLDDPKIREVLARWGISFRPETPEAPEFRHPGD